MLKICVAQLSQAFLGSIPGREDQLRCLLEVLPVLEPAVSGIVTMKA